MCTSLILRSLSLNINDLQIKHLWVKTQCQRHCLSIWPAVSLAKRPTKPKPLYFYLVCSPNTIPGFSPVSWFSPIRRKEHVGNISQIAVWHYCCNGRAMNWQLTFTFISCVWKRFTFGWQWSLMSGTNCDKASRVLMDSGSSLYRKLYFRTLTKCLLKFMGMSWLISKNFGPGNCSAALACQLSFLKVVIDQILYYCFSRSPLTTGTRLWVGPACVCVSGFSRRGGKWSPPPLNTSIIAGAYKENQQPNCQSGPATVNQVYTNVEDLW